MFKVLENYTHSLLTINYSEDEHVLDDGLGRLITKPIHFKKRIKESL